MRAELVKVDENCPERPYVELGLPKDVKAVIAVHFEIVARDQGLQILIPHDTIAIR